MDTGKRIPLNPFRKFMVLKIAAIVSGLKTILGAVIEYAKNIKDVIILICFSLSFFALLGLQAYMGALTSKCIMISPFNLSEIDKIKDTEEFRIHANNRSNQFILPGRNEPMLCRENADLCPENFICLMGFGSNPDYGYTNFDTFGWACLSSFRLMTRDYWEDVYHSILRTAGPWHMIFFVVIIFLGSVYLLTLNLSIVARTYYELQKKAKEEEEEALAVEEAAMAEFSRRDVEGDDHMIHKHKHSDNLFEDHEDENKKLDIKDKKKEEEKPIFKERCLAQCLKCEEFCCIWDCCTCWIYLQKFCSIIIFDPFMELFITICVVVNTLFMAMDHHDMEAEFYNLLRNGNYFFTAIYVTEAVLKLIARSPKFYFQEGWNKFDFFIAASSLIELYLEGVQGLAVLGLVRLLRVFKLAKTWPTLNLILSIMCPTVRALKKLIIIFGIFILIFAVMGMQLFGVNYIEFKHLFYGGKLPRYNFTDFLHSFMIIFRAVCGEWIETMWDCMLVSGWPCIPFFLAIVVICNLVMLNIFRAFLLSPFGISYLSIDPPGGNTKEIAEAFNRMSRAKNWVKQKLLSLFRGHCADVRNQNVDQTMEGGDMDDSGMFLSLMVDGRVSKTDKKSQIKKPELKTTLNCYEIDYQDAMASADTNPQTEEDGSSHKLETTSDIMVAEHPADCCPEICYWKIPFCAKDYKPDFWAKWKELRAKTFTLIEYKYFATIIMIMIIISSLALAAEDVNLKHRPLLKALLAYMDKIFTVLFVFEILIKWLAVGFKKYFTNAWCCLDFIITLIYVINILASEFGGGDIQAFKIIQTLRALQPLRALSRVAGQRELVTAIVKVSPAICKVLLVFLFLWLIFAIMGVQLFGGKFFYCTDGKEMINISYVNTRDDCVARNLTWINKAINFDNVLNAYLALLEVATFQGWINVMFAAEDSRLIDEQPLEEAHPMMYLYFVLFIIVGSFFTYNLFLGVIFELLNRGQLKIVKSREMYLTKNEKKYYNVMKNIRDKKPIKAISRPKFKPQAVVFDLTTNKKFDMAIMLIIGLNMVVIALDHYQMEKSFGLVLERLNMFFVAILTLECVLKIFAFRWYYFKKTCNKFDFVIVILSIIGVILQYLIEKNFLSPSLLGFVGVIKVARVLRLIRGAKGVCFLLYNLATLLPELFNILLLLFFVMFTYAIFGMSLFKTVKHRYGINENCNFETFGQSMILLFQMATVCWDTVFDGLMAELDCNHPNPETGDPSNCGSKGIAIAYLVSYLMISRLIMVNFIAVIFQKYSQITRYVHKGLTEDDYDMYYETWLLFDPDGTQFIRYELLSDFLDALKEPLQIPKPNKYKIISMDIAICKGDLIYCVDILDALTKNFFGRKGHVIEETSKIADVVPNNDRGGLEGVSSSLSRQREENCAHVIQQGWRRYKGRGGEGDSPRLQQQTIM